MSADPRVVLERHFAPEVLGALERLVHERAAELAASKLVGKPWLTAAEAGELLACSPEAVRKRCRRGRLEHRHMGRRLYVSGESVATLVEPNYAGRIRQQRAVPARMVPPGTRPRKEPQS